MNFNNEKILNQIVLDIKKIFKDNLVSIIQFGSSVRGDYVPARSDINLLVIRKRNNTDELEKLNKIFRYWFKKINLAIPLILTEKEIKTSTDVFPMEYIDIKEFNKVLYGKDIFKKLRIEMKNLRLELENQVKGKLILLRGAFIRNVHNKKLLNSILLEALPSILVILKNILNLNKVKIPVNTNEIISSVEKMTHLELRNIKFLIQIKQNKTRLNLEELKELYKRIIIEMEHLADHIDKFKVKKKKK